MRWLKGLQGLYLQKEAFGFQLIGFLGARASSLKNGTLESQDFGRVIIDTKREMKGRTVTVNEARPHSNNRRSIDRGCGDSRGKGRY